MSYTCPDCGMTSHNPHDERFRYCGNCHEFKGETDWRELASRTPEDHDAFRARHIAMLDAWAERMHER